MNRLVSKALWREIEPLLPPHPPSPRGGRPRCDDRTCLEGIVYLLRNGIPWQNMPARFASGSTCWRRLREWTAADVWPELHRRLLRRLGKRGRIHLERVVIDSASVRAVKGGVTPAPTPWIGRKRAANAM